MQESKSNSRRRFKAGASGDIKVVEGISETDGFVNEQWEPNDHTKEPTPWKTISIILTLFMGGCICLVCAIWDWMADANQERTDRIWALIIIGLLTIIPGGYYFFVLCCILLHRPGYTLDDIRRLG